MEGDIYLHSCIKKIKFDWNNLNPKFWQGAKKNTKFYIKKYKKLITLINFLWSIIYVTPSLLHRYMSNSCLMFLARKSDQRGKCIIIGGKIQKKIANFKLSYQQLKLIALKMSFPLREQTWEPKFKNKWYHKSFYSILDRYPYIVIILIPVLAFLTRMKLIYFLSLPNFKTENFFENLDIMAIHYVLYVN